ncbi:FAD-linked oxidase C-terminal domain-containing protein, partial [Mycolicibacterium sp. 050158]|uniref:FAD-linked oxidase C-terminal domain-containing protein n=1 Tax=Mycolicibacterium sp. 050158 TaxID=3090602 RepID=UPI00299CF3DA
DAPWVSPATVPSAYLHPRFQGQEPPGFPGRFSGTITGEHGVGLLKRGGLVNELSPTVLGLHRAIKYALDPAGILNPGKIFE